MTDDDSLESKHVAVIIILCNKFVAFDLTHILYAIDSIDSLIKAASVSGFFTSFRSHYGSGVDSSTNRNEYQEHFLGGKGGRCVRLKTLPPSCAVVTKSGNLNFLESSGPLQACNGTDLPLPLIKACRLLN